MLYIAIRPPRGAPSGFHPHGNGQCRPSRRIRSRPRRLENEAKAFRKNDHALSRLLPRLKRRSLFVIQKFVFGPCVWALIDC